MRRIFVNTWYKKDVNFQKHVNASKQAAYRDAYSAFKINPEVTRVEMETCIEDEYGEYSERYDIIYRTDYTRILILLAE